MRWLSVRSSRAISTLAISLTLTTTAAAAELPSQPPSPTPPPVPEPTQSHIRRQNTLVSPTQNAQEYAPTVTTTYAVMAQTDEDSPTPAAGADQAWNTVPVAAMMGLIMPNPDYDIYTGELSVERTEADSQASHTPSASSTMVAATTSSPGAG